MKIKNKSFKDKNKKWLKRHVDDEFVQKSISDNYRSRAAYKLVEIIEKYKILNEAKNVIDLGSAPGSWCQVLKNHGKSLNSIIAVDILKMAEIKVTVTDTHVKCLEYAAYSVQDWWVIAILNRARIAQDEIIAKLVEHCNANSIALAVGTDAQVTQAYTLKVVDTAKNVTDNMKLPE